MTLPQGENRAARAATRDQPGRQLHHRDTDEQQHQQHHGHDRPRSSDAASARPVAAPRPEPGCRARPSRRPPGGVPPRPPRHPAGRPPPGGAAGRARSPAADTAPDRPMPPALRGAGPTGCQLCRAASNIGVSGPTTAASSASSTASTSGRSKSPARRSRNRGHQGLIASRPASWGPPPVHHQRHPKFHDVFHVAPHQLASSARARRAGPRTPARRAPAAASGSAGPRPESHRWIRIIASLIRSAAEPWSGEFCAFRSP